MKYGLSDQMAENIAESIMEVVPYNINVMNSEGIIIASGDKSRIGRLHQGALKAIHKNDIFEVEQDSITDKMGVNIPFSFEDEIVGVIGISGAPEKVRAFGYITKVVAELMIKQQYTLNKNLRKQFVFESFLREWCDTPQSSYSDSFLRQAAEFGVNLSNLRICAILETKKPKVDTVAAYLQQDEYAIRYKDSVLLILQDAPRLQARLEELKRQVPGIVAVGVGNRSQDLFLSNMQAQKCIFYKYKMGMAADVVFFEDCLSYDVVEQYGGKDLFELMLQKIEEHDESHDLIKTLLAYFDLNGDMGGIAKSLHIHRNTLSYRLQKIESIVGKSFKSSEGYFYYYILYCTYKLS